MRKLLSNTMPEQTTTNPSHEPKQWSGKRKSLKIAGLALGGAVAGGLAGAWVSDNGATDKRTDALVIETCAKAYGDGSYVEGTSCGSVYDKFEEQNNLNETAMTEVARLAREDADTLDANKNITATFGAVVGGAASLIVAASVIRK